MFYREHKHVYAQHSDEMVTKQSHKDECDIHNIIGQFKRTGVITHVRDAMPRFEDIPAGIDYQAMLDTVLQAQYAFEALPSSVRAEYMNDPGRFLAALEDPKQVDKLRELGVFKPDEQAPRQATPAPAPAVAPAAAPEAPAASNSPA